MGGVGTSVVSRDLLALAPWLPAGAVALVIAENFYKFHSFTLECLAFLATTAVLHVTGRLILAIVRPSS
jgi:hypothetical protein